LVDVVSYTWKSILWPVLKFTAKRIKQGANIVFDLIKITWKEIIELLDLTGRGIKTALEFTWNKVVWPILDNTARATVSIVKNSWSASKWIYFNTIVPFFTKVLWPIACFVCKWGIKVPLTSLHDGIFFLGK